MGQNLIILISAIFLAACSESSLNISSRSIGPNISGKLELPVGTLGISKVTTALKHPIQYLDQVFSGKPMSALSCDISAFQVQVYSVDIATGLRSTDPVATGSVTSTDGSYVVPTTQAVLSAIESATKISYVIDVIGCSSELVVTRPLTSTKNQNVTAMTNLIGAILNLAQVDRVKLTAVTPTQLNNFMNEVSVALGTSFDSTLAFYQALAGDATLAAKFFTLFGINVTDLQFALPRIYKVIMPTTANEHQVKTFAILAANHWNSNYNIVYVWKIDGVVASTTNELLYRPKANAQGTHTIDLEMGFDDGTGVIDTGKPYYQDSVTVTVSNTVLATPPVMTISGMQADKLTSRNINVSIRTGVNFANCESFSTLALTESSTAPTSAGDYTITCSTAGNQIEPFTIASAGEGAKTLYLWARDAAGNVGPVASVLNVVLLGTPVDAQSTVIASPSNNVPADSSTYSQVTVTLKDSLMNVVPGKTVSIASSRGATDTITAVNAVTNSNGQAIFKVTSLTPGTATITATDVTDSFVLSTTPTITFTSGGVSGINSTLTKDGSTAIADGVDVATLTVTIKDLANAAMSGRSVTLISSRGSDDVISPASATTDVNGQAVFTVKSTTIGNATFTAKDLADGILVNQTQTINFKYGPVSLTASTLVLADSVLEPGGTTTATLTLKDELGHLVEDTSRASSLNITLLATGTSAGTFSAFTAVTDTPGVFVSTFTATDGGTPNTVRAYYQGVGAFSNSATITVDPRKFTIAGPSTVTIGACSSPFVVTHRNASGTALNVAANKVVSFGSVGQGAIYTDAGCTVPVSTITIAANTSSKVFYFKDLTKETVTLSVQSSGVTSGTAKINVIGTPATTIRLTGVSPVVADTCSAVNLATLDAQKNVTAVTANTTVTLNAPDYTTIYSDSACTNAVTTVAVLANQSAAVFYFKNPKVGSYILSASATGLAEGNFTFKVVPAAPVRLVFVGPSTLMAGTCSAGVYISAVDQKGNIAPVPANTVVTLAGKGSGGFFSGAACTGSLTTRTIAKNNHTTGFYYRNQVAETVTFSASAPGLATATHTLVSEPAAVAKLKLANTGNTIIPFVTNSCIPYIASSIDATSGGNQQSVSSNITVNLGGNGGGAFYSDSGCTSTTSSVQIDSGTSSKVFYFKTATAATYTFTAADPTVTLANATNLSVVIRATGLQWSGPQTMAVGTCSTYTVTNTNSAGTPVNVGSNTNVNLTGNGSGSFYSDAACTVAVTALQIDSGTSSKTVYFKDLINQSLNFSAAASSIGTGLYTVNVGASKLQLAGAASIAVNTCSAYTLTTKDSADTTTSIDANTTFNLNGSGAGYFYSDAGCTTAITSIDIASGSSTQTFYYKNETAESVALQAAATNYTSGNLVVTTTASAPVKVYISGSNNITKSICSSAYTVYAADSLDNAVSTFGAQVDATLVGSGSVQFFSDSTCTTPVSIVSLTTGTPTGTFYIKNNVRESFTMETTSSLTSNQIRVLAAAPVDQIVTGLYHSCGLTNGEVKCWGINNVGQLGNESFLDSSIPVPVRGLTGITKIAAGGNNTCAITSAGALKCWGGNGYGQVGNNSLASQNVPAQVVGLTSGVTDVSIGLNHVCAIKSGDLYCWGYGEYGQLGIASINFRMTPAQVTSLTNIVGISTGSYWSCALNSSGAMKCWGLNNVGQLGNNTTGASSTPVQVSGFTSNVQSLSKASNGGSVCAVYRTGSDDGAYCWGDGSSGRLGNGASADRLTPTAIPTLTTGVTKLAYGYAHGCAIQNGSLFCWGYNATGQLGVGHLSNSTVTRQVIGLTEQVTDVANGRDHTCAIVRGQVACWGSNSNGQLGLGLLGQSSAPVQVSGLTSGVSEVHMGTNHACARIGDSLKCWGSNISGQVGIGTTVASESPVTVNTLGTSSGVSAFGTGNAYTCAVVNGAVKCWGIATSGQLGNAYVANKLEPSSNVVGLSSGVTSLSAGVSHACAIQSGAVKCWGLNTNGQLGLGTTVTQFISKATDITSGATAVSAGAQHTCAIQNGAVKCWGLNSSGQLGVGTTTTNFNSIAVSGLSSNVTNVSSGQYHSCAIQSGALKCWGDNTYGQLGDNSVVNKTVPTQVSNMTSGVTSVSAGSNFTCAVKNAGVYCWGVNSKGQLGTSESGQSLIPLVVEGLETGVSKVTASKDGSSACALLSSGGVKCWGLNTSSQLGTGTTLASYITTPNFILPLDEVQSTLPYDGSVATGAKIVIKGPTTTIKAKTCSSVMSINLVDSVGNAAYTDDDTEVTVTGLGSGQLYTDSACETAADPVIIPAATSTVNLYYKNDVSESSAMVASIEEYLPGSYLINVDPEPAVKLAWSNDVTAVAGVCSSAVTLRTLNTNGTTYVTPSNLVVTVTTNRNGAFYSDASCSNMISTVTIAAGTSSKVLYFKSKFREVSIGTATAENLTSANANFTTTKAAAAKLAMKGPGASRIGACVGPYSVSARDAYGNLTSVSSNTTVNLSNTSGGKFYSDTSCTAEITSIGIVANDSVTANFYMRTVKPDSQLLIASATGLTSDLFTVQTISDVAHHLKMAGPTTLPTGTCSSAVTITAQDAFGYPTAQQKAAIAVTLSDRGSATTHTDSACTSANTATHTIALGEYTQTYYLKDNVAESLTIIGSATDLESATYAVTTTASTSNKLVISGAGSIIHGSCGTYVVGVQDSNNNPTTAASNITVNLSESGSGTFYSDSGCTSLATSVVITSGSTSQAFYYKSAVIATRVITAADNALALTNGTLSVVARTTGLVFTAGPTNLAPGACSSVYTVTNKNSAGTNTNVGANTTVNLAGGGSGTFYTDSGCTTSTTTISIANGTSSQSFYFKDATNEYLTLTATATNIAVATYKVSVGTMKSELAGSTSINTGTCTAYTLTTKDGTGATTNVSTNRTFNLIGNGSGKFYSDAGCTTAITSTTVTSGSSSNVFYYQNNLAETVILQANLAGYTSANLSVVINSQAASALSIVGPAQVAASACSEAFVVSTTDATGNAKNFPSNTTLSLSGNGAGTFYSDANCITSTSSLSVTAGASDTKFYYRNTNANLTLTFTVTDGNAALTSATKTILTTNEVAKISAGEYHACAIKAGGVYCWGANNEGQLGNGEHFTSRPKLVVNAESGAIDVSSGRVHTCAVFQSGKVKCWGYNRYGQLGDGETSDKRNPVEVLLPSAAVAVSSGANSTCALMADQTVYCWGQNAYGNSGDGTKTNNLTPVKVLNLSGVTSLATGGNHSCAVVNGGVYCWGRGEYGQQGDGTLEHRTMPVQVPSLPQGSGVTAVTAGSLGTCALKNGGVLCWGANAAGQVGDGGTASVSTPYQLPDFPSGSGVTSIALGSSLTTGQAQACAVQNGAVKCWGSNVNGEIGNSLLTASQQTPSTSVFSGATAVTAGTSFTCAIVNKLPKCWGINNYGQLGNGDNAYVIVPQDVAGLGAGSGVTDLFSGLYQTCAVVNGGVKCWGENNYYQVGNGVNTTTSLPADVLTLGPGSGVTQVRGYREQMCAIVTGVGVKCWGRNVYGAIGDETAYYSAQTPATVLGLPSTNVTSIGVGSSFACAAVNGGAYCWGYNNVGQLGQLDKNSRSSAVEVAGLPQGSGVVEVAATVNTACARLSDGSIKCWGANTRGQLGDGTNIARLGPVDVTILERPATQMTLGYGNACVILDTGGMKCWGGGDNYALGNGITDYAYTPVEPVGMTANVTHINTRYYTSCAVQSGAAYCWGNNITGLSGDDGLWFIPFPQLVPTLTSGVTKVAPGVRHTCFLVNGGVKCIGNNAVGQLGIGTSLPPVTTPGFVLPF